MTSDLRHLRSAQPLPQFAFMVERALLLRAEPGFSLPAFERFEPPPPPAMVVARMDAASTAGDIVLDLFGRGGWVARSAIDRQRRAISLEASPLDRLLAEIVLRPPDLRHLDASFQALATSVRRESSLKASITDRYASRCASCGRPVILDELTWAAEGTDDDGGPSRARPVRKHYRCTVCRDQIGGGELRQAPLGPEDIGREVETEADNARDRLRDRFPVLEGGEALGDELLDLHTPRQLVALDAILTRIEGDRRAAQITAALRLAFLHALSPASRLATTAGRTTHLRIAGGHVRQPASTHWRERNPWLAFEDGVRVVRGFVQRLEGGGWGPVPARLGDDMRSLADGTANAVLKVATPAAVGALRTEAEQASGLPLRPRVKLVLGVPPLRPAGDRLAWAYHATAWALGREAASMLPLEPLFGPAVRASWGWQSAALTRSLRAVEPILDRDARVVFMLEGEGPDPMVASVLGGIAAGYRLVAARQAEAGREDIGVVELAVPGSGAIPGGPRTRAGRPLPLVPGGAGDPDVVPATRLFAPSERRPDAPFSAVDAARIVVGAAVDVLKLRGEPVPFDGLIGEILVGLDRAGHLRRLVHPVVPAPEPEAGPSAPGPSTSAGPRSPGATARPARDPGLRPMMDAGAAPDHVERILGLIRDALAAADGSRLIALPGDRWWLGDRADRDAAAVPLADRVEWAVYSILSTGGPLSEAAFTERVAGLFTGPDFPDQPLVRACLESYRSPSSTPDRLTTDDDLSRRSQEHGELIARLVDTGHRLGFACWIGARQQGRIVGGMPLGNRLDSREGAGPPYLGRTRPEELEEVDVIWYVRGRMAFLWEVEWTAMLGDTVLKRHARMPVDNRVVRFLVVLPERADLVRHKLARSPILGAALDEGGWHFMKANHVREWSGRDRVELADLEPLLGLDPAVERTGGQLAMFGG